ncbi:MAG: ribonuclease R [Actinobacteria bacterium HGW-Actinobacteria-1]|nr:MAG: ribonuclease R [Actinobacteria bacterium HGW-Actinobacteria-1]
MRPDKLVVKTLRAGGGKPMTAEDLAAALESEGLAESRITTILASLVKSGAVAEGPGGTYIALKERGLLVGRVTMNRRGFAFVVTPVGDIYVGRRDVNGAMHGDTVAVRLNNQRSREGRSGEIVQVLERAVTRVVGTFERHGALGIVTPTDARVRSDIFVPLKGDVQPKPNDIVVARITRYATQRDAMQGVIEEVLGPADAPGVDVEIVIREHSLPTSFSEEVESVANGLTQDGEAELARGRTDVRDVFTVTIDPTDAKDFDDAISIERRDGGFRMWVHIADVSHYVPWGSVIDEEARMRATSVYLVDRVIPMLPERLSNGICSLNPAEDRLTFTVEMDLDKTGLVEAYRLYPSVMRSDHRLDYDTVDLWLTSRGFANDELKRMLTDFRSAADAIHKRRIARGGLDFDTVEARVKLDDAGKPLEVVLRKRTVATNMIEEAMVLANEVVARHMRDAEAPMMYRIHEDPDPDALGQIAVILKEFDYPMKDIHGASPQTFQKIVKFAKGRPEELLINSLLLRALERARYSDILEGHFGLASDAYCHFTSPIRRYPDLIVHRLLKAQLTGTLDKEPVASMAHELGWLAEHCSVMEREAEAAEDSSQKVKLVQLMADHLGEVFEGIITGVMSFGFFVQLDNTAEGLVHVQTLGDDYYRFDAERFMLWGENRGKQFRLGQRLKVRVIDVSPAERRIDFEVA